VLTIPPRSRIYLAAQPTDMRKSFDGLQVAVRAVIEKDPLSGHFFVFCNRRRDRLKILLWDRSGFWVFAKRLEKGTFAWPRTDARSVELRSEELSVLLGGFDLARARRRAWYDRAPSD
jgi:transposase